VDVGELKGDTGRQRDELLLKFASTANIACGGHAGDIETMRSTIFACRSRQISISAHPGFPDRANFGREPIDMDDASIEQFVAGQVSTLDALCRESNTTLAAVKPHGALYSQAAELPNIAAAVCRGVQSVNPSLRVIGLAGSRFIDVIKQCGMYAVAEAFADRHYASDGSLVPRTETNAVIDDPELAAHRVLRIVRDGVVEDENGRPLSVQAQTICIHGDNPNALAIAKRIQSILAENGIAISSDLID
jgi:UPF0271 protein